MKISIVWGTRLQFMNIDKAVFLLNNNIKMIMEKNVNGKRLKWEKMEIENDEDVNPEAVCFFFVKYQRH